MNESSPEANGNPAPELRWYGPDQNPWGVRVLDVRPITEGMISTSQDPECAANAISFGGDDGSGFIGEPPLTSDTFPANLRYRIGRRLADGVLFTPRVMEHKWAIFFHESRIMFVRSWTRKVHLVADVSHAGDHIEIPRITGALTGEEGEEFIVRAVDYMLRSHVLGLSFPAPLPVDLAGDPERAALWCFSSFGSRAWFATPEPIVFQEPNDPLRSNSLLHIAVARGDTARINAQLDRGIPVDLLALDGLAPLHWAQAGNNLEAAKLLLKRGSPVDVRTEEGATCLMQAIQDDNEEQTRFFLDHGADPNAADLRGFTALHRAAEMGHAELVKVLLERGANANVEAQGLTPRMLAEQRGHAGIVEMLKD